MAKWLVFLCLLPTTALSFQQAEVYRWVDENGNVHFSDLPQNPEAKLFSVKPGITSKADTAEMPVQPQVEDSELTAAEEGEMAFREAPNSAEACRDLRVEMNQRSRDLNSGNPEKARQARIFLDLADKLLAQSNC
ncbi:DUF4124 domain-containing protein [Thalassotalea euphylliae]|uniref:DUF4124 domain-containing protein n=1 Tax=Thalassotalea euphylliae TaxID=1655234 RepID=UPI003641F5C0